MAWREIVKVPELPKKRLFIPAEELTMLKRIGARDFNAFLRSRLRWDDATVCAIGEGPALAVVRS